LIFDGELPAGIRIPQGEIATALGKSRIPIREAIVALEREGWVTLVFNRGAFVAQLSEDAVRDHYELIGFAYGLAARRAAQQPDRTALTDRLAQISRDLRDPTQLDRFGRATVDFHAAVVEAAGSPRIKSMLRGTTAIVPGNFFEQVPGAAMVEKRHLAAIRKALSQGDGDRAAMEYQTMLRKLGEQVVTTLQGRGFFDAHAAVAG
jgi:DNA-binding GntR family transcriptional regulator